MAGHTHDALYIGKGLGDVSLLLKYANRHGLIAGATGTGKTLTLQGLVEGFSRTGVPTFVADVKGDLSGLGATGGGNPKVEARAAEIGYALAYQSAPTIFWDLNGAKGHPLRVTVSEMGPLLLSRLLELNDTQEGVMNVAFAVADAEGLLLLDFDDLRAILTYLTENAAEISARYGAVSAQSVAAIQRALLVLEQQGARQLFGEPALDIADLLLVTPDGQGAVNILAADRLMQQPRLYATFMLWLLSELFEDLPEVGDLDKPKLVFFFDEAHLLFDEAPKALLDKVEQLVRLIRSKGVGVYFITQNPADIPESILGQLSNRVQHALRAFTPQDQKGVRAAAETFRPNPAFKTEEAITALGVGEALVSVLDEKGIPTVVDRVLVRPPVTRVGPLTDAERKALMEQSPVGAVYDTPLNRESAHELLQARAIEAQQQAKPVDNPWGGWQSSRQRQTPQSATSRSTTGYGAPRRAPSGGGVGGEVTKIASKVARDMMATAGRELVRGLMKSLLKGR